MSRIRAFLRSSLFTYETPKVVIIESKLIGILNKVMQAILFAIVIIYIFIINNGYQYIDNGAIGGTTTKLKGIAFSNTTDERVGRRMWDAADLHIPPQDSGAFFVTTNIITTRNQVQSTCTDFGEWQTECSSDSECLKAGEPFHLAHGVSTGKCNTSAGYCIVEAWCPTEYDVLPNGGEYAALQGVKDFTVFIKNHVYFPYYEKLRSNLIESITKKSLRGCNYHPKDDPYCPIFRLGTIVGLAGRRSSEPDREKDDEYFEEMAVEGGVISISVKWDCNFDYADEKCKPKYEFTRLDNLRPDAVSNGYNFRYPQMYMEDGIQKRQLVKAFGILFLLNTEAEARAFDTTTFLLNVGSGLALISIAALVSDVALFHIHKNRSYFKRFKQDPKVTVEKRKIETKKQNEGEEHGEAMVSSSDSSVVDQKCSPA